MTYGLILIPIISAFIGWFANWLAIKMLFHPRKPKKILWFTLHGIFPKKQHQFAEKLGKLLSEELISFSDIKEKVIHPGNVQKIMPLVEEHIEQFLRVKLPKEMPVIGMFIGDKTIISVAQIAYGLGGGYGHGKKKNNKAVKNEKSKFFRFRDLK